MTTPQFDPNLPAYLQAWRQYLEQLAGAAAAPGLTVPGLAFPGLPQLPPNPLLPPALPPLPPAAAPPPHPGTAPAAPSADYIQQLLNTLQAWRQYLETSMRTRPAAPTPAEADPPAEHVVLAPYLDDASRSEPVPPPTGSGPPAPRVGSAYPPETAVRAAEDYVQSTPRSLYSSAAQPTSPPTTQWWEAGSSPTSEPPAPTAGTSKTEYQPPSDEGQTQRTGPAGDEGDGSASGVKPPDKLQHVAPLRQDLSLHPRLELIQPSRDLAR